MSKSAKIVMGEAPESDSDDELNVSNGVAVPSQNITRGRIIDGEAPESDEEPTIGQSESLDSISSAVSASSSLSSVKKQKLQKKSGSLLANKLCERNVSLAKNVSDFVSQNITTANNELNTVDQHLLKCQVKVQEAADSLKLLVSDISKIEYKIETMLSTNYIPDIKVTQNAST